MKIEEKKGFPDIKFVGRVQLLLAVSTRGFLDTFSNQSNFWFDQ